MKNIIITVLAIPILCIQVNGQSIFQKYLNNDDVAVFSISPKMFKMLAKISISSKDPQAQEYFDIVRSINNFKVLVSSNQEINDNISKWVTEFILDNDLKKLMSIKELGNNINFFAKNGKKQGHLKQLLMHAKENLNKSQNIIDIRQNEIKSILMLLEGEIDLNKISKLADKMVIPGGEQLGKVRKLKLNR